jgi:predicted alpha/beta-hydrolase family hydrolase
MFPEAQPLTLEVAADQRVSALWLQPADARACHVFAHGAGAGMAHAFMNSAARGLAERGIATLRYQFVYMERGSKRPDAPVLAHAAVRAAAAEALRRAPQLPLFAGGKSFGGRMTSQAQAAVALPGVRGLVFFGFPLHPAGKPSVERAAHLAQVACPMLFVQGTRDELADVGLLQSVLDGLGEHATLVSLPDADHSFHVPAKSGRKDAEVLADALDGVARWMDAVMRG